jgi:hypothetical protein
LSNSESPGEPLENLEMLIWSGAAQAVTKVASLPAPKLLIVVPLIAACILIAVSISFFAHRGKLHIPGYAGIAALGFVLSLISGKFAGSRSIAGTSVGVFLSILCFLLLAVAVGSIIALFFYRHSSGA